MKESIWARNHSQYKIIMRVLHKMGARWCGGDYLSYFNPMITHRLTEVSIYMQRRYGNPSYIITYGEITNDILDEHITLDTLIDRMQPWEV